MGEVIGCSIGLNCQLKFSNNIFVDGNFKSHITDRHFVSKPTFNFSYPVSIFAVAFDKSADLIDSQDNIFDL